MPRLLTGLLSLLLLSALWLAPAPARAQEYSGPLTMRPRNHQDTVYAVRRLFKARNKSGASLASYGAVSAGAVGAFALMPLANSSWSEQMPVVSIASGLSLGTTWLIMGLKRMGRYSDQHRDEVLAAFEQGEPLPEYVQRRLTPEYFGAGRQQRLAARLTWLRNRLR